MYKMTLLSIAAATLLLTGCGEETKEAAKETASSAVQTAQTAAKETKEAAVNAAQAVKERAKEAVETTKEAVAPVVEAAKETAADAAKTVQEAVTPEANATQDTGKEEASTQETQQEAPAEATADNAAGKAIYAKCASCHGVDGKTLALGKSAVIAGQSAADVEAKIGEYKAGTRNVAGMGMLMKGQVAGLSDEDVKAVAAYIQSL